MTATRTLYRQANVSPAEATASLYKRFPTIDLVSFVKKVATAEEAAAAKANVGDLVYEAKIRVAEFPPAEEETSGGDDAGGEDAGAPAPKEKESDPDGDGDNDSSPEGDTDGDFAGKDKGEGGEHKGVEPKKLGPEEQMIHLLQQILDALNGGGDPLGDDMGGPGGPGMDLPDVGAPDKGDMMPPPGGPMGGGKPPLPPPVKEKSPIGAGAFAHVAGNSEIQMIREDANKVNNKQILAEASQYAPTHRVAKIARTGLAKVGNDLIDLAEANSALVTLVSK